MKWIKDLAQSFTPRAYIIAGVVLLVVAALSVAYCSGRSDQRKITKGEIAERSLEGERLANEAGEKRDESRRQSDADTKKELEEIHESDPDAAKAPATRGGRAVADRLR